MKVKCVRYIDPNKITLREGSVATVTVCMRELARLMAHTLTDGAIAIVHHTLNKM